MPGTNILRIFVICLAVSVTLQYSTFYISYDEKGMNMSEMYETIDTTKADCQHQCTVDDRCKSFVVFENDQDNSTCGFSENQDYHSVTNCTTCSVNLKNCSSGSITYTEFLNGYIGTNQYANFDAANVNFVKCSKLCNSDQFCNGFIFNSATRQCRHVDSSSVVPFSDAKFSFYRKDCPLGCTTYSDISLNATGTYYDVIENVTSKGCEYLCNNVSDCRGFTGDDVQQTCALSYSSRNANLDNCSTCSTYLKQCPIEKDTVPTKKCRATSFYEMGSNFESSATYRSFKNSTPATCYTECMNDEECWGYAFNAQTATCDLSINMFPQYTDCSHCTFVARDCSSSVDGYNVQCSSNFTAYGSNLTVSSTFFSSGSATFESCQQMCSDNTSCISFYHRSDTSECHLSKSSARTSADCSSCSYYIKQCWQGCSLISYSTTEFGYVTSSTLSDLSGQAMTYTQCKDMCTSDPLCYGFSHQADNQHCILSESGLHAWSPSCNTCSFSQKICLPETTTVPSNESCCSCKLKSNQTLDDLMAQRKQELTVNSETLSSTIRKQTCASDFRASSNVIGAFGVLVLIAVISLIVLPDLYTAVKFIIRKIIKFRKNQTRITLNQ